MGCGHLRFQLLHVLAAGPRISKSLDNIVQLVLLLYGLDFRLVVIRGGGELPSAASQNQGWHS